MSKTTGTRAASHIFLHFQLFFYVYLPSVSSDRAWRIDCFGQSFTQRIIIDSKNYYAWPPLSRFTVPQQSMLNTLWSGLCGWRISLSKGLMHSWVEAVPCTPLLLLVSSFYLYLYFSISLSLFLWYPCTRVHLQRSIHPNVRKLCSLLRLMYIMIKYITSIYRSVLQASTISLNEYKVLNNCEFLIIDFQIYGIIN